MSDGARTPRPTQPLDEIRWVRPGELHANDYNPNKVFRPELELLKRSILADGWTQPIVARPDGEIVDGFHRFTLANTDAEVAAKAGGFVPVVYITPEPGDQRASTVRHNRARGAHHVVKMSAIVRSLMDEDGWSRERVMRELGMEREEVERLYDRGSMVERGSTDSFSKGWVPN